MKSVNINENFLELSNHKTGEIFYFSSEIGLYEFLKWRQEDPRKPVSKNKFIDGQKVAELAMGQVGKFFNKELGSQCAAFTRSILTAAGYDIGLADPPADGYLDPYGPDYANSLCGDNLGKKIGALVELLPGDLVFFDNTFGDYPVGTITHVGIYVGNGKFVHRPGQGRANELTALSRYSALREGRRLYI